MPALARPADNLGDVTDRLIGYFVGRGDAGPVEGLGVLITSVVDTRVLIKGEDLRCGGAV